MWIKLNKDQALYSHRLLKALFLKEIQARDVRQVDNAGTG